MNRNSSTPFLDIKTLLLIFTGVLTLIILAYIILASFKIHERIQQEKQELLLRVAKNTTQQLTYSFIIPTLHVSSDIQLSLPNQYNLLQEILKTSLESFDITIFSLYNPQGNLLVASQERKVISLPEKIQTILEEQQTPVFELTLPSAISLLFDTFERTTASLYYPIVLPYNVVYPFSIERAEDPIFWGTLHIILDTSKETALLAKNYRQIALFTGVIIITSIAVILLVLYRAERIILSKVKALEAMKQTLNHNERLASMGRTVAAIAHEIRNPLGIIYSSVDIALQSQGGLDPKKIQLLHMIQKETARLRTLVNTFLEYANPNVPQNTPINITNTIAQITTFLAEELNTKHIHISCTIPENIALISEQNLLYRLLFNVINNATEAEGVTQITITEQTTKDAFIIIIQDNGKGFPLLSLQVDYTEPFYTTKDTGTGLGLSIVKSIMENHQGSVVLENNNGAIIQLIFPIARKSIEN